MDDALGRRELARLMLRQVLHEKDPYVRRIDIGREPQVDAGHEGDLLTQVYPQRKGLASEVEHSEAFDLRIVVENPGDQDAVIIKDDVDRVGRVVFVEHIDSHEEEYDNAHDIHLHQIAPYDEREGDDGACEIPARGFCGAAGKSPCDHRREMTVFYDG